jgi:hypothetical protein
MWTDDHFTVEIAVGSSAAASKSFEAPRSATPTTLATQYNTQSRFNTPKITQISSVRSSRASSSPLLAQPASLDQHGDIEIPESPVEPSTPLGADVPHSPTVETREHAPNIDTPHTPLLSLSVSTPTTTSSSSIVPPSEVETL